MAGMITFWIGTTVMLILLLGGLWIAFAVGIGGSLVLYPMLKEASLILIGIVAWDTTNDFILMALPLFIFMGEYVSSTGLVSRLYSGIDKVIRGLPGGLIQTNLVVCTVFAACSGSSVASAATMARVAYQEQVKQRGYHPGLVHGSIAGGGALDLLIPPSIFFIIYGSMADQSVGKLYIAGIVPGLMISLMFMLYVGIRCRLQPRLIPRDSHQEIATWRTRLSGLKDIWPFVVLISFVLGSIYAGVATPTEAAGIGSFMSIVIGAYYRVFTWKGLKETCISTVRTNSMLFLLLINAKVLSVALGYYGIPALMRSLAETLQSPVLVLTVISVAYLLLGLIFDDFSLMLLITPFVVPLVQTIGYDLIWFGVYMCILLEAGLLSPPVGMVLFVIQTVTGAPFMEVVKGSIPFFFILLMGAIIVVLEPGIALWLVNF